MKTLLKLGNSIFFVLSLFWVYFTIYYIFDFFKTDFTQLTQLDAKILVLLTGGFFILFHFKEFLKRLLESVVTFALTHKIFIFIFLFSVQIYLTLTSVGLAAGDTTVIYQFAADKDLAQATTYISFNPNNYLLFLWFRFNFLLFSDNSIVALAIWNAFFIDCSIWLVYKMSRLWLKEGIANIVLMLSVLILGLQPQHIYTYSDPIALFLVSLFIYLILKAISKKSLIWSLLAGFAFALSYGFRPPTMIFIIAGVIVFGVKLLAKKQFLIVELKLITGFIAAFVSLTMMISYSLEHQDLVAFEKNQSRTMLYYVDLGLTYNGSDHADLPEEVVNAVGSERNASALEDIEQRLEGYDFTTFTGHLFYKYYWMTNEGMFGWLRESVLDEERLPQLSWLIPIQNSYLARLTRTYVYAKGENYYLYAMFFQLIWIIISIGLVAYAFNFNSKDFYSLWMQITIFGALLFLMIFEAGRSRYLIQFLPAILTISAIGLSKFYDKIMIKS